MWKKRPIINICLQWVVAVYTTTLSPLGEPVAGSLPTVSSWGLTAAGTPAILTLSVGLSTGWIGACSTTPTMGCGLATVPRGNAFGTVVVTMTKTYGIHHVRRRADHHRRLVPCDTRARAYCHVSSYQKARASPCALHAAEGTLQLAEGNLQLSGGTLHDAGDNRGGRHAGEGGWHDASGSGKKLFKISGFFLRRLGGKLYFCKIILRVLQDSCIFCKIIPRVLQDSCIFAR